MVWSKNPENCIRNTDSDLKVQKAYCLRTGEFARNNVEFVAEIEKRGYMRKKKKSGMWLQGLQLKDTDFGE